MEHFSSNVRNERMKWSIAGFLPRRVAWITAILSLLLVPVHFHVSCDLSGIIGMYSYILLGITGVLSLADKTGRKAMPFGLAVIGIVAHTLCTH